MVNFRAGQTPSFADVYKRELQDAGSRMRMAQGFEIRPLMGMITVTYTL